MERYVNEAGAELLLDDALYPIVISTWSGQASVESVARFYSWTTAQVEGARERGELLITISDATAALRPTADVRRAFAESEPAADVVIRSYAVIDNVLVRGAMTAVGWLMGDKFDVTTCATFDDAFAQALELARSRGLPLPSDDAIAAYVARSTARVG